MRETDICNGIVDCSNAEDEIESNRCNKQKCNAYGGKWCRRRNNQTGIYSRCTRKINDCDVDLLTKDVCDDFGRLWCKVKGVPRCISKTSLKTCDYFGKDICESIGWVYCKKPEYDMESIFSMVTPAQLIYEDIGSGEENDDLQTSLAGYANDAEKIDENQCVESFRECHSSEVTKDVCERVLSGKTCKIFPGRVVITSDNNNDDGLDPNLFSSRNLGSNLLYSKLSFSELSEVHELLKQNVQTESL